MKLNLKEVYEGWRNHLVPPSKLKELILQTSNERLEICRACDFNSEVKRAAGIPFDSSWRKDEHCTRCSCPLLQKTKALHASCPLNMEEDGLEPKWGPVLKDTESFEINKAIEDAEKHSD